MSSSGKSRKVERTDPDRAERADGVAEYLEDRQVRLVAAQYDDLVAAVPEKHRDWIRQVALAVGGLPSEEHARWRLEWFLRLVRLHTEKGWGDPLFTAMILLNTQDYEKRPWDDDSGALFEALPHSTYNLTSLLAAVLAEGNAEARSLAAKWLPKYLDDSASVPILTGLLHDSAETARNWAAIHLSRLQPDTPGLVAALTAQLAGRGCQSARLHWDFGLTGGGEAAEALGHMGARALPAVPDLMAAIRDAARSHLDYDGQLAASAVARIAGSREALALLEPLAREIPPENQWMDAILDEIKQGIAGAPIERSPDDPAHACFFARFLWRPGEDDYWKYRTRNARGAY